MRPKPKPVWKGKPPFKKFPHKKTMFKNKNGGKVSRGTPSKLKSQTICWKCGKKGHISTSTECPMYGKSVPKGSGKAPGTSLFTVLQPCVGTVNVPSVVAQPKPNSQPFASYINVAHVCTCARAVCGQSTDDSNRDVDRVTVSWGFPIDLRTFAGLSTHPGHALVDTGAQSGVVGLESWQIWVPGLAEHGLQPLCV